MSLDLASLLLTYVGWAFIPRFATRFVLSVYYKLCVRCDNRPAKGSPRYERHYGRAYTLVISSYLLYTLFRSFVAIRIEGDFYGVLGVLPSTNNRTIKSRFRRMAAVHHPDKIQGSLNDRSSDAMFVHLKLAQDTLLDPAKRYAYDRFGRDAISAGEDAEASKGAGDHFFAGLYSVLPQYLAGFVAILFFNLFWFSSWARYWRFYIFFALFTLEFILLTQPNPVFMPAAYLPVWLSSLLHLDSFYLLPFQILSLARAASISANIFISQLAPPEGASKTSSSPKRDNTLRLETQQQIAAVAQLSHSYDTELTELLRHELAPFAGSKTIASRLREQIKERISTVSVRDDPGVKEVVERVLEQQRESQQET